MPFTVARSPSANTTPRIYHRQGRPWTGSATTRDTDSASARALQQIAASVSSLQLAFEAMGDNMSRLESKVDDMATSLSARVVLLESQVQFLQADQSLLKSFAEEPTHRRSPEPADYTASQRPQDIVSTPPRHPQTEFNPPSTSSPKPSSAGARAMDYSAIPFSTEAF